MSFIILAETDTEECENDLFPNGLTWFFERVGKFNDNCEFRQIEKILSIDFSCFNFTTYSYDDEGHPIENWFDINSTLETVHNAIKAINNNPDFHNSVIYDSTYEAFDDWKAEKDANFKRMIEVKEKFASNELTKLEYENAISSLISPEPIWPIKNEYLSKGELVKDLKKFCTILHCYMKNGAKNFGILYM